jgi:hypothetical protein
MNSPSGKLVQSRVTRRKSSWKPTKDDAIIAFLVLSGLAFLVAVCTLTPVKNFTIEPVAALFAKAKPPSGMSSGYDKGLYHLAEVHVAIGRREEFFDGDFDIEYDRTALRAAHTLRNKDDELDYLESVDSRIRDTIVTGFSDFSFEERSGMTAMERGKETLVTTTNEAIGSDSDIVTNVYVRRFIVFPPIEYVD